MKRLVLLAALLLVAEPTRAQEGARYHITSWVDWDDQRVTLGDAYLEGPSNIAFDLRLWFINQLVLDARILPSGEDSTVRYSAFIQSRQRAGESARGLPLWEEDTYHRVVRVRLGEAALLSQRITPDSGETATVNILIEGPHVPLPASPRRWQILGAGIRLGQDIGGGLQIQPRLWGGAMRVSVSTVAGGAARVVRVPTPWMQFVVVEGVRDSLRVQRVSAVGPESYACIQIRRWQAVSTAARGEEALGPLLGSVCFPNRDPWSPVEARLSTGQRLRVQMVAVP